MKALKEKRNSFRSLWRMGLVILTVFAFVFAACGNSGGATDPGDGVGPVTGITISGDTTVQAGKTIQLTATLAPAGATDAVTWASDKPEVATVGGGLVTGLSAGTAKITATAGTISESVDVTVEGSAGKTVNTFEIDTATLPIGYEGQVPNISNLTGRIWWSDGTMTEFEDENLRALGFTTQPAVFSATEGDLTATTTSVYIFHKDRQSVQVKKNVLGVHPLVGAASAADLVPDLAGTSFAKMATDGRANAYGYRTTGKIAEWYEDNPEPDLSAIEVTAYYLPFTSTSADLKFKAIQTFKLGPEYLYVTYDDSIGKTPLGSSPADLAVSDKKYDYGVEPLAKADVKDKLQGYLNVLISGSESDRNSIKNLSLPIEKYNWVRYVELEAITWKNPDGDAKDADGNAYGFWYEDNVVNNKNGVTGLPASPPTVPERIKYWTDVVLNSGIQVRVTYEGTDGILTETKLRGTDYVRRAVNRSLAAIETSTENPGSGLPDFTQLEEGAESVYLKFVYYPDNLATKPTGGYYPNVVSKAGGEVPGLTIPLATFNEEIDFVRRKKTAVEAPVPYFASRYNETSWHQTLQDTWKLVGIYTSPDGARIERDIRDDKWDTPAKAVNITNWADIRTYEETVPENIKLEATIRWAADVLGSRNGDIMYGQIYNGVGNDNSTEPTVQANR